MNSDNKSLEDGNFTHLAELCNLEGLNGLDLTGADFFSHSIFQLLEVRGDQISTLSLNDVDEMNLNAVILIGDRCPNLTKLELIKCHYQMEIGDARSVDRLVKERKNKNEASLKYYQNSGMHNIQSYHNFNQMLFMAW